MVGLASLICCSHCVLQPCEPDIRNHIRVLHHIGLSGYDWTRPQVSYTFFSFSFFKYIQYDFLLVCLSLGTNQVSVLRTDRWFRIDFLIWCNGFFPITSFPRILMFHICIWLKETMQNFRFEPAGLNVFVLFWRFAGSICGLTRRARRRKSLLRSTLTTWWPSFRRRWTMNPFSRRNTVGVARVLYFCCLFFLS